MIYSPFVLRRRYCAVSKDESRCFSLDRTIPVECHTERSQRQRDLESGRAVNPSLGAHEKTSLFFMVLIQDPAAAGLVQDHGRVFYTKNSLGVDNRHRLIRIPGEIERLPWDILYDLRP